MPALSQYTIRNVPEGVDRELREWAKRRGVSLNEAAIEALKRGLGITGGGPEFHDLDDLIGTWKADQKCDRALADQDRIEPDLWR
jgi:hypothetical protein